MTIFDRILNKHVNISEVESPIILGRYLFKSEQADILLNNSCVKKQEYLVPSSSFIGEILFKSDKIRLLFDENELLNENIKSLIKKTLIDVSTQLKVINNPLDLTEMNILLRNFDENLQLSELEIFIESKLKHLQAICERPSYNLNRDINKVNVSRAKRVPVKAINYLAAHTEDWSRRRINSVEPRTVLSEIFDYNSEIYENKITYSLIEKILNDFSKRMNSEIDIIADFNDDIILIIESRKIENSNEIIFWRKKLESDYKKLGKAIDSSGENITKILEIRKKIKPIQNRLFLLKNKFDTILSKTARKKIGAQKLKRTNLFDNHQHYRFVKILWDACHRKELAAPLHKSEENQIIVQSFVDYAWVLVLRALFSIGYDGINKLSDYSFRLTNKNISQISINIIKNEFQIIEIFIDDRKLIFIPVPTTKNKLDAFPKENKNTFYLSLGSSDVRDDIIKISPTEINSEAQIAKILFNYMLKSFTQKYLYQLDSQSIAKFKVVSSWLKNNKSLILNKGENGKIDFWINRKMNKNEIKEFADVIKTQQQNLSARTDIRSDELYELNQIKEELERNSLKHFEEYEKCISCSALNESNLLPNYEGGFRYKCNSRGCEVEYGYNRKNIFYKVPNYLQILKNLSRKGYVNSEKDILNAFGYEHI